ncbi:MAG: DUF6624 domain-containing protein [Actinomycetes bacterium]
MDCAERDQAARAAHAEAAAAQHDEHLGWGAPTVDRIVDVDEANDALLWPLVTQYGWLGSHLVGADGAHACWLLAQHAPRHHRATYLQFMIEAVAGGNASATDLAYLHDRVSVDRYRPQAFGTQYLAVFSNPPRLWPIENGVNIRRAAARLPPLSTENLAAIWTPGDLRRIRIITRARCC